MLKNCLSLCAPIISALGSLRQKGHRVSEDIARRPWLQRRLGITLTLVYMDSCVPSIRLGILHEVFVVTEFTYKCYKIVTVDNLISQRSKGAAELNSPNDSFW